MHRPPAISESIHSKVVGTSFPENRQQESKKKQLQEEAKKVVAEKEEVEAEVETAKTEVAARDVEIGWRYNLPTAITTRASRMVMMVFMFIFFSI